MRKHPPGFTLIELLTVMAIIVILAGLVLGTNGYVQKKGARARAEAEIAALSAALESYKADNGIYPREAASTDALDAKTSFDPSTYASSSLYLYKQLSGDANANRIFDTGETKSYFEFKPRMLQPSGGAGTVTAIVDPFGNSYGYSTACRADYEVQSAKTPPGTVTKGYNPTFDLWSTAGQTTSAGSGQWIKNW